MCPSVVYKNSEKWRVFQCTRTRDGKNRDSLRVYTTGTSTAVLFVVQRAVREVTSGTSKKQSNSSLPGWECISIIPISIYFESSGVPMALQSTRTCWKRTRNRHSHVLQRTRVLLWRTGLVQFNAIFQCTWNEKWGSNGSTEKGG